MLRPSQDHTSNTLSCRRRDSNPHSLRHTPLKRACLPISPLRQSDVHNINSVASFQCYTFHLFRVRPTRNGKIALNNRTRNQGLSGRKSRNFCEIPMPQFDWSGKNKRPGNLRSRPPIIYVEPFVVLCPGLDSNQHTGKGTTPSK